jgi:FkbM family methyltransferase
MVVPSFVFGSLKNMIGHYDLHITGIIHVGAQYAQETEDYKKSGVKNIMWFEANTDLVNLYYKNEKPKAAQSVMYNALLSDTDDTEVVFFVASNGGGSSSMFKPAQHSVSWPEITFVPRKLRTVRFDTFVSKLEIDIKPYNFLVVDVQGAELNVVKGFGSHLNQIDAIVVEVATAYFYEGQCLFNEINEFFTNNNFILRDSRVSGFGEALYIRKEN